MNEQGEPIRDDYILVALDASPHSAAALAAAVELAAALHLELRGIFVEDVNLLHLCGLPFGLEIGSFTARPRRLQQTHIEREFRMQASLLRKIMADVAGQRRVTWSFQVVRGAVTDQLLAAAASAQMVSLGRVGRSPGKRIGSTAQAVARNTQRPVLIQTANRTLSGPISVVDTGTVAAEHAVALAARLATQDGSTLYLYVASETSQKRAEPELPASAQSVEVRHSASLPDLLAEVRTITRGTVILPTDVAAWLDDIAVTVIVVP